MLLLFSYINRIYIYSAFWIAFFMSLYTFNASFTKTINQDYY